MSVKRRICFCLKPLGPQAFVETSLKIFLGMAIFGLSTYFFDLYQSPSKSKSESLYLSFKILLNIFINLFSVYAYTCFKKENWGVVRNYGLFMVVMKTLKLAAYVLGCLINAGLYLYIIKDAKSTDSKFETLTDILVELLSLVLGVLAFAWVIFMGLGLIKMASFLGQQEQKQFSEVRADLASDHSSVNTQIITVAENEAAEDI